MSITNNPFTTNPAGQGNLQKPGQAPIPKKTNPEDLAKQRKREQLEKQQLQIQKKLDTIKSSIYKPLQDLARVLAAAGDPNEDPQELFRQIRPLLSKMNIANIADASKTELVVGRTRKDESLYKIVLRRSAQITEDIIERIKRQGNYFESMQWSAKALELYLWYPYVNKLEESAPTPTPGTPPTPTGTP